jgi:hypothetical protein
MKQTHKDPVKDAAQKRRDYLVAKAKIHSISETSRIAVVIFTIGTGFMFLVDFGHFLPTWVVLIAGLLNAVLAAVAYRIMKRADARAKALTYVPPVAEQIAALPASDVLLRGSEQPIAAPEELLRAAQTGSETASEELLRAQHTR